MRNFNNHFISALFTVDPHFHFYLWDCILPQVTMTLNMLRRSQLNPGLSAYEHVYGIHNFEWTPLAPLGCNVQVQDKPQKQPNYSTHSVYGWYLGTELHHYICYTCYYIDTGGETAPNAIYFFPSFIKFPTTVKDIWLFMMPQIWQRPSRHLDQNHLSKWGNTNSNQ